jgi:predicted esterase
MAGRFGVSRLPDTGRIKPPKNGTAHRVDDGGYVVELIGHKVLQDVPRPRRIVIMLHGIGQHAGYMEEGAKYFSERMQDTLVVMPEAPLKMRYSAEKVARVRDKYDPGFDPAKARSWFQTQTYKWPGLSLRVAFNKLQVVHQINKLADFYRDKYGLQDKDIAFFGMSQGGAIATYAAIARQQPCAGVVNHSGMFFGFARATSRPETMLITGRDDDYLCNNKSFMKSFFVSPDNSLRRLLRRGIPVTDIRCDHLGHEMTKDSLKIAGDFLARVFGLPAKANQPAAAAPSAPAATA